MTNDHDNLDYSEPSLIDELWASTDLLFQGRLTWLLVLGPLAVLGDATGLLGEAGCFAFSGIALIPCAERLSFITEQVAEHTNGTIGALLNATFGNAPELLISVAALRAGYYRVVQLAMLGSMLTNMLLVFGLSCIIGGLRWDVQDLRIVSGNVSVVMLMVATAGSLFPAILVLSGEMVTNSKNTNIPTPEEVTFCRVNAFVMFILYLMYLLFQIGTHKQEFDVDLPLSRRVRRNLFCLRVMGRAHLAMTGREFEGFEELPLIKLRHSDHPKESDEEEGVIMHLENADSDEERISRRKQPTNGGLMNTRIPERSQFIHQTSKNSDIASPDDLDNEVDEFDISHRHSVPHSDGPLISMRVGVIWLFIITLCVSAMSDILVDTIDGFARRFKISEVFTSMIIIPFFSNVAEQVSAFLFAYRNEMDLCIGVTVGSAIQIATFVLPGSVLIGALMGRSMTLYFHAYETAALFFGVLVTGAILQGGTTNWLTGMMLVGIYIMFAAGVWFHELEDLTVDGEDLIRNFTSIVN